MTDKSEDSSLQQHVDVESCVQILYADGDSESIFLPMERVRLNVSPGERLAAPTAEELTATAQHLLRAADAASDIEKIGEDASKSYNISPHSPYLHLKLR